MTTSLLICPSCARENSNANAFCGGCGSPLQRICASCRHANPLDHAYCGSCGHPLAAPADAFPVAAAPVAAARLAPSYTPPHLVQSIFTHPSTLEGERKEVTVLFVDVMGSMELAQGIDAEEWHAILDRFFHILTAGVHRFEGTINQYTGDGIMALFGAPIAHEDHAQRACHAALYLVDHLRVYAQELRRERGLDFVVRMGVNSGDVVVGRIGDDLRMDYTAQGYAVGLASRLLDVAEAGRIYVTQAVAERVRDFFELEDLGDFRFKGASAPVRVFALAGQGAVRTRFDAARQRGLSTFLGRNREMELLEDRLGSALRGRGHVIGIVGGPGIGKTRLCREFLARCAERGIQTSAGSALPHGKLTPFLPVLELLRSLFNIQRDESGEQVRARLEKRLLQLGGISPKNLPLLFEFLEVPDAARPTPRTVAAGRRQLNRLLSRVLEASGPRVLLLEDLHWLDGGSEAFLELIVDVAARCPLLVLLNFRRDYRAAWMHKPHVERLQLAPLEEPAARDLVRVLVGEDASEELTRALLERTSGNPFFIEELVRTLRESGGLNTALDAVQLPSSIQSLIAARIDRLPAREKALLHAAAVAGQTFSAGLVARVLEVPEAELVQAFADLVEGGFFNERSEPGAPAGYAFRYPLTQEVAYRSQLAERRARVHRRVAEALESEASHGGETIPATLAHHWEQAAEFARAAHWHARAARDVALKDPAAAVRHWLDVRTLLERAPRSPEGGALLVEASIQLLEIGRMLTLPADLLGSVFRGGRERAVELGDKLALASLDRSYAFHSLIDGSLDEAARCFEEAIELGTDGAERVRELRTWQAMAHVYGGRLALASAALEELTAEPEAAPQDRAADAAGPAAEAASSPRAFGPERGAALAVHPSVWGLVMLALSRSYAGQFSDARRAIERLAKLAAAAGSDPRVAGMTHNVEALYAWSIGDLDAAQAHARSGVQVFEGIGRPHEAVFSYVQLGAAECLDGQCSRAVTTLERAQALARSGPNPISETEILVQLAHAYIGLGEPSFALSLARSAVEVAQRRCARLLEGDAQLVLARALRHAHGIGETSGIEQALEAAEQCVLHSGALAKQPFVHLDRAAYAWALGQSDRRRHELEEARRRFAAIGAAPHAARVERILAAR